METKLLMQLFPHLKDSFDKEELPISFIVARGGEAKVQELVSCRVTTCLNDQPRRGRPADMTYIRGAPGCQPKTIQ
jgi:hypothetical protein